MLCVSNYFSEEAIQQWGNPTTRTASEMEIYSFERAATKVYLQPKDFHDKAR